MFIKEKVFSKKMSDLDKGHILWNNYKNMNRIRGHHLKKKYSKTEIEKILLAIDDENSRLKGWNANDF